MARAIEGGDPQTLAAVEAGLSLCVLGAAAGEIAARRHGLNVQRRQGHVWRGQGVGAHDGQHEWLQLGRGCVLDAAFLASDWQVRAFRPADVGLRFEAGLALPWNRPDGARRRRNLDLARRKTGGRGPSRASRLTDI
jgi:hypothetical protein